MANPAAGCLQCQPGTPSVQFEGLSGSPGHRAQAVRQEGREHFMTAARFVPQGVRADRSNLCRVNGKVGCEDLARNRAQDPTFKKGPALHGSRPSGFQRVQKRMWSMHAQAAGSQAQTSHPCMPCPQASNTTPAGEGHLPVPKKVLVQRRSNPFRQVRLGVCCSCRFTCVQVLTLIDVSRSGQSSGLHAAAHAGTQSLGCPTQEGLPTRLGSYACVLCLCVQSRWSEKPCALG